MGKPSFELRRAVDRRWSRWYVLVPLSATRSHSLRTTTPAAGSERTSYLGRILDVLEAVASAPTSGVSISKLAEAEGAPLSTVSRLVRLLDERGFVRRLPDRRLVPGPKLVTLGLRSLRSLPGDQYGAAAAALADLTGESVSVGLLLGSEITLVARHDSKHPLRVVASVGDVIAPHSSAMGKAILSHVPDRRRIEILEHAVGPGTAPVLSALRRELADAAAHGYARDEEAYAVGLRCVAAPLLDPQGAAVGAISISGPAARFSRELADGCIPSLLAQTGRLSRTSSIAREMP